MWGMYKIVSFLFLNEQFWNTIVCLFPRLSLDISVRTMVAKSRVKVSYFLNF